MKKVIPKSDKIINSTDPTVVVGPNDGNLHEITEYGGIGCCFLDIMAPPYDTTEGRVITFYELSILGYAKPIDAY
jgi:hypothetical protein